MLLFLGYNCVTNIPWYLIRKQQTFLINQEDTIKWIFGKKRYPQMPPLASITTARAHVHVNSARAARLFFFLLTNWISCDAFVCTRKTPQHENHDRELKHETVLSTHTSQGRGGTESVPECVAWLNCVNHVTSVLRLRLLLFRFYFLYFCNFLFFWLFTKRHGRQNLGFDVRHLRFVSCDVTFGFEITSGCRP